MNLDMENQSGNFLLRDYRKGNWTVQETMVLIEAKQKDEERRMNSEGKSFKPQEHRWKWVEDYCWIHGCLRSQNQCNDKWDNLMRDFKKVRDFERRMAEKGEENQEGKCSYWKIERSERKEKNLPSNILPQIYEALVEVVERKGQRVFGGGGGGGSSSGGGGTSNVRPNIVSSVLGQRQRPTCSIVQAIPLPPQLQHHTSAPIAVLPLPPSPQQPPQPPPPPPPPPPQSLPYSQPLQISDSDTSEYSDSPAKRRRKGKERGEGTSNAAAAVGTEITNSDKVGSAISKSASLIAGVIQESEEREERRHRELLSIHERRLQIEESKSEINRQGINGLVDCINKLAHSFLALAAHKTQPAPK